MQNPIQKFRQGSIVLEKPGVLSDKLKTLTCFNYHTVEYFLLELWTLFLFTNVYKTVFRIIFILFRFLRELFAKVKKDLASTEFRGGSRAAATSKIERFVHRALHLGCCSSPRSASELKEAAIFFIIF